MNDDTATLAQMRAQLARFVAERQWEKYHDAKNLAMSIAIEAAELMEHFQWIRNEELPALKSDGAVMDKIRDEIADVLAYTMGLANVLEIDLAAAYEAKMRKNAAKYPAEMYRGWYSKPEPGA